MSWGRIDDGFTHHPKVLALRTKARRWTWLEVLSYTWRYGSALVPPEIKDVVPDATPRYLDECEQIGLLDRDPQGRRRVHDWPLYADQTIAEKVAYYLTENPMASANEVVKAVRGTREITLAEVKKFQEQSQTGGSGGGSAEPPETPEEPVRPNRQSGSESGSPARGPDPLETVEDQNQGQGRASNTEFALVPTTTTALETSQSLVAHFVDRSRELGSDPPARVKGQIARQIGELLREKIEPEKVRAGLDLLLERRLHPSTLPSAVHEAAMPPAARRDGRLTAGQVLTNAHHLQREGR